MEFVVTFEMGGNLDLISISREYSKYFDLEIARTKFAKNSFGKSEIFC